MEFPIRVEKTWGHEIWFANDPVKNYCGKELAFRRGWRCSLHMHPIKDEVFYVTAGLFLIEYGSNPESLKTLQLGMGTQFHVQTGLWHRMTAIGVRGDNGGYATLIEVSTFHDDNDVVRHTPGGLSPNLEFLPHSPVVASSFPAVC